MAAGCPGPRGAGLRRTEPPPGQLQHPGAGAEAGYGGTAVAQRGGQGAGAAAASRIRRRRRPRQVQDRGPRVIAVDEVGLVLGRVRLGEAVIVVGTGRRPAPSPVTRTLKSGPAGLSGTGGTRPILAYPACSASGLAAGAVLAALRVLTATGLAVAPPGDHRSRPIRSTARTRLHPPVQEALPRVPGPGRCADPRCQTAARASPALAPRAAFDQAQPWTHRRRSAWRSIASSSGSAPISRTSCAQRHRDGDPGSPPQRLLACGHVDDREPAHDPLGYGHRRPPRRRARTLARPVFQLAGGHVHAGAARPLVDHRSAARSPLGVLAGDVVHRVGTERDQVLRHPRLRCPGGLLRPYPDS